MFDGEAFGAEIVAAVKSYVGTVTGPLLAEIEALKGQVSELQAREMPQPLRGEPGEKGDPGEPGAEPSPEQIASAVEAYLAANPPAAGKDGVDGSDGAPGKDADPIAPEMISEAVRTYIEANPPAPGKDAEPVDPEVVRAMVLDAVSAIPAAQDGKDADPEVIRTMIAEAVEALPPPAAGKDADPITPEQIDASVQRHIAANPIKTVTAEDLEPVIATRVAEAVAAIPPAQDGKDAAQIASFVKDHTGSLVVTLSDGRVIDTGIRDGAKGDPGRDGLTLTDFDTELSENGRLLTLSLENDEIIIRHELQLPVMIYRGGFKEGQTYQEGDTVTFGGSLWCCASETTEKPEADREAWRLAARKGRDGRDLRDAKA